VRRIEDHAAWPARGLDPLDDVEANAVEDGKVIDFITRTTPTSGAEQSFLQNAMKNLLRF